MDAKHHEAQHGDGIPELESIKEFWRERGTTVTIAAAVVAVVIVGTNMYRSHKQRAVADASAQLAAAESLQDLEAIVADHGSTPAVPLALLQLAKGLYDKGDYTGAMSRYETFLDRYSDHELASVAKVGLIHCREARGELEAAEADFEAFAEAHPDSFLVPTARLGQARCLEQLGQFDAARIVYEDLIADYDDSVWSDRATEQLESIDVRREAYNNPSTPVAPVMPELALPDAEENSAAGMVPITIPQPAGDAQE